MQTGAAEVECHEYAVQREVDRNLRNVKLNKTEKTVQLVLLQRAFASYFVRHVRPRTHSYCVWNFVNFVFFFSLQWLMFVMCYCQINPFATNVRAYFFRFDKLPNKMNVFSTTFNRVLVWEISPRLRNKIAKTANNRETANKIDVFYVTKLKYSFIFFLYDHETINRFKRFNENSRIDLPWENTGDTKKATKN